MITTRRTVLKSIAAALMAPTIRLRPEMPDERLLLPFCSGDDYCRYAMAKPFGIGSLTYATDSRAMVRCELAARQQDGEIKLPPVEMAWKKHWVPDQWIPLTPDNARANSKERPAACPECGDRRISLGETLPPLSDPWWEDPVNFPEYDVDDNTIRDKSCPLCHGRDYAGPGITKICGVYHSSWNLRRILALPNVMVSRSRSVVDVLLFRADGFEGVSMGVLE